MICDGYNGGGALAVDTMPLKVQVETIKDLEVPSCFESLFLWRRAKAIYDAHSFVPHRHAAYKVSDLWSKGNALSCLLETFLFATGGKPEAMVAEVMDRLKSRPTYTSIDNLYQILVEIHTSTSTPFMFVKDPFITEPHVKADERWRRLLSAVGGILICLCSTLPYKSQWTHVRGEETWPQKHYVTFDAWRGLLYLGGGIAALVLAAAHLHLTHLHVTQCT